MHKTFALTFVALALVLIGCVGSGGSPRSDSYTARPDALATQQAVDARLAATQAALADIAVQATLEAARTQAAAEAEIALLLAQAEATRQAFEMQAVQAEATRQAEQYQAEATRQAGSVTATAQAAARQTAQAYPGTATAQAFAMNEIARREREQTLRAQWEERLIPLQILLPSLLWFTIPILLILAAVLAYRRFMPVLEARGRAFLRGPHDAPVFVWQAGNRMIVFDPDRSFGPALLVGPEGATSTGLAPDPQLQERVTARDQALDAVRAMPGENLARKPAERLLGTAPPPPLGEPVKIEILSPEDSSQVDNWITEVERKLLTDGESGP